MGAVLSGSTALCLSTKSGEVHTALAAFDEVVLPALRCIETDFRAGVLSDTELSDACRILRQIIADLATDRAESSRPAAAILCIPAGGEGAELAAPMLAHALAESDTMATVFSAKLLAAESVEQAVALLAPATICISPMPRRGR